jgi:ABC-type multidrug transport system fused ATPase/permease subunit
MVVLVILLLDPAEFAAGRNTSLADLLPVLGVIAFAGQRMMPELQRLYSALTMLKFGTAAVDSVFADLEGTRFAPDLRHTGDAPLRLTSELRLADVSYRYPNAAKDSLQRSSLTIRAGERIGIVGGTGAGKTTLADLVLGLLAPTEGRILVDGVAIDDTTRRRWQRSVAYVPQELFLVDASIYENIAFGLKSGQVDRARVEESARLAQLDAFVRRDLPQGYDTTIGERGVRLSGGQRQRIGIARALYHDADLIVFDEATSALDNLTEREVMAAIEATPGDKTMLIIAHRLSTVRSCDRIIVLDKGQVVGIGPWAELMEENAAFRDLATAA